MTYRIPNSKPWITDGDKAAVQAVLDSPVFGSEVAAFERGLAEFLGREYVVCVSSGTLALELAFGAGPEEGNSVGAFGFIATAHAVERNGGVVEFTDLHIDPVLGELAPHDGGSTWIADAAQAFGAKLPPSLADCYSFNWNKPITCLGGGCVATDDHDLHVRIRRLRNQGRSDVPRGVYALEPGTNARMSDMQAALGRSQLRRVGEILERRKERWLWYSLELPGELDVSELVESPFLYPIELSNRDEVHAKMLTKGIQTRSCADWLLPAHPYYAEKYGYKRGDFPEAERRADRTLLLPLFPEMTLEQVREVCAALEACDARS